MLGWCARSLRGVLGAIGSSLKLKLILFLGIILGVTVGIAPWSAIKMQERQLLEGSRQRLLAMHEMLARTVAASMVARDRESIQKLLEALTKHRDIEAVRIFDVQGVIHFSSNPDERGERLSPEELSRYHGQVDPVVLTHSGGRSTYRLVEPMLNQPACSSCHDPQQKVVGILEVNMSLDPTEQQLAGLKRLAFSATAIAMGVIAVGIWLALTWLVDQPLQQLVEVMAHAEHGDLSARARTGRNDELGKLARHFNDMISKLDAAQGQLEQYHREQMARVDRLASLGEMAAAMAHEIRNPLTGISGALSVMSRGFAEDDPRREIVRQIRLLIDRLNKSVEDILDYSRPSRPQLQAVSLADIVERSLSLVEGEAKKVQVHVVREAAQQPLPLVTADPHQIQQVLTNLMLNAIQATPCGGEIRIRMGISGNHRPEQYARIEVEDTGKGMTPEETAQAFQPFFSTKPHGTGLGLPIAKQIIEQHYGRIALRSKPGNGTCVEIELPVRVQPRREETEPGKLGV